MAKKSKLSVDQKKRTQARIFRQRVTKSKGIKEALDNVSFELARLRSDTSCQNVLYGLETFLEQDFSKSLMNYKYISHKKDVCDIGRFSLEKFKETDLISWFEKIICFFSTEINEFHIERDKFYTSLLLNQYEDATCTLEYIEETFGYSIWSYSARMSIYNFSGDRDSFIRLENELNATEDKLSKTILLYNLAKSNLLVSCERYMFSLGKMLEELKVQGNKKGEESILFRHTFDPSYKYENICSIFNHDGEGRLVDLYLNFLRFLSYFYINNTDLINSKNTLLELKEKINDRSLHKLIDRIVGINNEDEIDQLHKDATISYYEGDYKKAKEICIYAIDKWPYISSFYEPLAKSCVYSGCNKLPENNNVYQLITKQINIISNNDDIQSIKSLKKDFHTLSYTHWSYSILAFIDSYSYELSNTVNLAYDFNDSTSLSQSLFSLRDISEDKEIFNNFDSKPLDWRNIKLSADLAFYHREYSSALELYHSLLSKVDVPSIRSTIASKICECYFLNDNLLACSKMIGDEIRHGGNLFGFPLSPISKKISKTVSYSNDNEQLEEFALILNKHNRINKPEYVQTVSNLVENLLENHEITTPEELGKNLSMFSVPLLLEVLTIDVLDGMPIIFSSTEEVLAARINILKYVTFSTEDLDIIKRGTAELRGAYQKLIARFCSESTGEGKISVDHEQLKSTIYNNVNTELTEIKSITERNLGTDSHNNAPDIVKSSKNSDVEVEYKMISDEFHNRLHLLMLNLLEEYTVNKLYGIDQSLNVGIRHGEMLNWLWSPLRRNNLAANKISDGKFVADDKWKSSLKIDLNYYNDELIDEMVDVIVEFNKRISKLIVEAKNSVHISTGEFIEHDKIFNYLILVDDIELLANKIDTLDTDEFINLVFSIFDKQTESNIEEARNVFVPKLNDDVSKCIIKLEKDIAKYKIEEISNSIKQTKIDMSNRISELTEWFNWQKYSDIDFVPSIALEKAKQVIQEVHHPMLVNLNGTYDCNFKFEGKHFSRMVSLFSLILENACKHSLCREGLDINYLIELRDGDIYMEFSNEVNEYNSNKCDAIDNIKSRINNSFVDEATRETKSGIYKIKRILSHEMGLKNNIDLNLNHKVFNIIISIVN